MGQELGIDTSLLRAHTDPVAGSIARSIQADAFTYGNDLYFAPGSYQPSSRAGQRMLAHELSHVAAQRSGADRGGAGPLSIGRADDPVESAADRSADRVIGALRRSRHHSLRVGSEPAGTVRRQVAPGKYEVNTKGSLRDDDGQHTVLATLAVGTKVDVLDKAGRQSQFKAGRVRTNEHSWSSTPAAGVGWIEDGKLDGLAGQLDRAISATPRPSIEELQTLIQARPESERRQVAADDSFLARAKKKLDEDTYLGLLPALGVHKKPTKKQLSQGGAAHTPGPDADRAIRAHLQQYLANAIRDGRQVEGEVSVVGDKDFQLAFDRQWVRAAGQTFPGQKASDVCNAFVDVNLPKRHIWVHRDKGDTGTVIHEGMHKYADDVLRDQQIALCNTAAIAHGGTSRLDEGITEYFTRIVVEQLGLPQRVNYENEFQVASKLAERFGERLLARAYYDGRLALLRKAVGKRWPEFAERVERKDWRWLATNNFM